MMRNRLGLYAATLVIAALAAGCHDGTGPLSSVRAAAGLYVLTSVNGEAVPTSDPSAPISGSVYLWPTGRAERHVTYRAYGGGTESVESVGTFHFENGAIVLELRPSDGAAPGFWRIHGSLENATLALGYPGPADGWINEEYRRR